MLNLDHLMPKKMEPWYELKLSDHAALEPGRRKAHFYSMLHSQKHDYEADLRLVLTDKDITDFTANPLTLDAYRGAPGFTDAMAVCREIVIRLHSQPGRELLVSTAPAEEARKMGYGSGRFAHVPVGEWRPRPKINTGQVASHVRGGGRKLDL